MMARQSEHTRASKSIGWKPLAILATTLLPGCSSISMDLPVTMPDGTVQMAHAEATYEWVDAASDVTFSMNQMTGLSLHMKRTISPSAEAIKAATDGMNAMIERAVSAGVEAGLKAAAPIAP